MGNENILAAVDFSPASGTALRAGIALAQRFNAQLFVVFVQPTTDLRYALQHGIQGKMEVGKPMKLRVQSHIHRRLQKLCGRRIDPDNDFKFLVKYGSPVAEIIRLAGNLRSSYIVIGTRGMSRSATLILGSVALDVIRKAPCPVITVRKSMK